MLRKSGKRVVKAKLPPMSCKNSKYDYFEGIETVWYWKSVDPGQLVISKANHGTIFFLIREGFADLLDRRVQAAVPQDPANVPFRHSLVCTNTGLALRVEVESLKVKHTQSNAIFLPAVMEPRMPNSNSNTHQAP